MTNKNRDRLERRLYGNCGKGKIDLKKKKQKEKGHIFRLSDIQNKMLSILVRCEFTFTRYLWTSTALTQKYVFPGDCKYIFETHSWKSFNWQIDTINAQAHYRYPNSNHALGWRYRAPYVLFCSCLRLCRDLELEIKLNGDALCSYDLCSYLRA